ncbi:MAG TPA: fatty acid desaturase [Blastocatellia bacterium]|nr:fatty acid desaturase [Blastocatellia bacterium]
MKTYNIAGYILMLLYCVLAAAFAPSDWNPWIGLAVGLAYLLLIWFWGGVYVALFLHLGVAHRALDFNEGFSKIVTIAYNTLGIYVNPTTWVNRHRHHHSYSDKPGDPNKLDEDGFWRTMYLLFFPYKCISNLATDKICSSWTFRLVSNSYYAVFSQISSYCVLWLILGDWKYALTLWLGVRIFAVWVNMIQNYWTHDRRFGTRRYADDDNAMNITEWLPVTATFSACLQNNHHHYSPLVRLSHDTNEYDFGFMVVRFLKACGLVEATDSGLRMPADISLQEVGL